MYLGRLLVLWRSGVWCGDDGALLRRSNHLLLPPDPSTAGRKVLDVGVVDACTHSSHPHMSDACTHRSHPHISACLLRLDAHIRAGVTPAYQPTLPLPLLHTYTYTHIHMPPHIYTSIYHPTYTLVSVRTYGGSIWC